MARRRKLIDLTPVCNKCGKPAPINEELTNENWAVYESSKPCECGGKFLAKFYIDELKMRKND